MDYNTLEKVKALSPEAAKVVAWGIKLEGALHIIGDHPDELPTVEQIRAFARNAIRPK